MIEQQAVVTRVAPGQVWITSQQTGCGTCSQLASCSTASLAKLLPKREFSLECELNLQVGDEVLVGIDDTHLLSTSMLLYLLPIVVMLVCVGIANMILSVAIVNNWLPVIALLSLLLVFCLLHRFQAILLWYFCFKPQILQKM
jgi:sigma-E factor negative regulatory protein RseC